MSDLPSLVCRICKNDAPHSEYVVREMMYGLRENFRYFRCVECGCLQITDIPIDLSRWYPSDYYSFRSKDFVRPRGLRQTLERWRVAYHLFGTGELKARFAKQIVDPPEALDRVEPLLQHCAVRSFTASFLDVGCGTGSSWLRDLKILGFSRLMGADPFITKSLDEDGIIIKRAEVSEIDGKFDVISFHHSLEHMIDQAGTLNAARERLKPNGICLVRIPVVSSLAWDMYQINWVELDAPRHLYLHSQKSIVATAESAGFELVHHFCDSTAFEFWGSEQYVRGIPLRSPESFADNPDGSDFTFREMASFRALAARVNSEGRGGRGVFVFRPRPCT